MTEEPFGNWLWQAMDSADQNALRPHMTICHLPQGDCLLTTGQAVDVVYFPVSAEVANMIPFADGKAALASTVSRNGVTGLAAFLAEEPIGWDLRVVIGGLAWRLPTEVLRNQCDKNPPLLNLLLGLTHQNQIEASVNAACHARHELTPRLARWLLMTQERTGLSELQVRQHDIADWMGVQRTSVVGSFGALSKLGAVRTHRGRLTILDRGQLNSTACECYGRTTRRFDPQGHPG